MATQRVGHITPSSNTVLEPLTARMNLAFDGHVSHHFTRIGVRTIGLDTAAARQFGEDAFANAARLLNDADVHAILWNGTSGSWTGVTAEVELCDRLATETGVPVLTSTLALLEALAEHGLTRVGVAVPYTSDLTARIVAEYRAQGIEVVQTASMELSINREFAATGASELRTLIRRADHPCAQALMVVCTNLAAAPLVPELERELGKPIFDSVSTTFWKGLRMVGVTHSVDGWGALLANEVVRTHVTGGEQHPPAGS